MKKQWIIGKDQNFIKHLSNVLNLDYYENAGLHIAFYGSMRKIFEKSWKDGGSHHENSV